MNIERANEDIECYSLLHKILVLQLNQVAIQFFKKDKYVIYNHTLNLYLQKTIENIEVREHLFAGISKSNG